MRLGIEAGSHTLDVAQSYGVKGVPIFVDQLIDEGIQTTLKPLREHGLSVCQIGAFGFNPLLPSDAEAEKLNRAIEMAPDTGCSYIVINGGNYHPTGFLGGDVRNFSDEALNTIADYLKPFVERAEKQGVRLSIEPYLKGAIGTAERFLALKQRIQSDALRVNIDVTSLYDYRAMWDPSPVVEKVCTSLAGHYGLGHIKDIVLNEGFHIHIDLAPLGSSLTDWSQVLSLMSPNMPDDSWMILEHVSTPEEAAHSISLLRDAATKAGVELS